MCHTSRLLSIWCLYKALGLDAAEEADGDSSPAGAVQYATMAQLEQILQQQKEVAEAEASATDPEGRVAAGEKEGGARGAKKRKKGKKQTGHRRP